MREIGKISVYGGMPEILTLTHVLEQPLVVYFENEEKTTEFGGFLYHSPFIFFATQKR